MWCLKRCVRLAQAAALAAAGAVLPILFADPAGAASTGDWGWNALPQPVLAGSTYVLRDTYPMLPCHTQTCTYDDQMLVEVEAQNGTTITTPVGTTTDFVNGTTGEVIGSCSVQTTTTYFCRATSSGSVNGGPEEELTQSLRRSGNLEFAIPADQALGSVAIRYSWNDGSPQGEPNDTYDFFAGSEAPPVPMANAWVAGGGAGLLGLGAVGYVMYRRRRVHAQSPVPV